MKNEIRAAQSVMLLLMDDLIALATAREEDGTEIVRVLLEVTTGRIFETIEKLDDLLHDVTAELDELRKEGRANPTGGNGYQPKRGEWIGGEIGRCSVCGHEGCASDIWNEGPKEKGFCPYCGALLWEEGNGT